MAATATMAVMAMAMLSATVAMVLRIGMAQMTAATASATAGVVAKMVAATAETAAMTVAGREGMALTAVKVAATATKDCTGGRDGSNSRKSRNSSSTCMDGDEGFLW